MTKLKSITRRTLSVLLCMVMLLTVFMSVPFTASAATKYSFEENGIRYLELDDSTVSVVGVNPETMPEDVVIPETVQGKIVTEIGERAFYRSNIKSIILPETVETIGQYAFSTSMSLESATILGNITTLSNRVFYYCPYLREINLPDSITHIGVRALAVCKIENFELPKNLESIGEYAFSGCGIKQLTIPATLHTIGDSAFNGLYNLTEVTFEERTTRLPLGKRAFDSCEKLTSFDFTYCDKIDSYTFVNCSGLTSITLPDYVDITSAEGAFYGCSNLKTVTLSENMTAIPNEFFVGCINLESIQGSEITSIGNSAFKYCNSITNYDFPYCTYIGDEAFYNCRGLTNVTFPDNIDVTLGDGVFSQCNYLKTVTLPDNITAIPNDCFYNCFNLESVQVNKITSIGNNAFGKCKSITNYDFPYCTNIGSGAFSSCTGLISITFPDNIDVTLGSSAFSGCSNLKTVDLSDNTYTIPSSCFLDCTSLESIQGGKITSVGSSAFKNCPNITSFDFSNCTYIGSGAFSSCTGLINVTFSDNIDVTLGSSAFSGCSNLKTVVLSNNTYTIPESCFLDCTSLESIQGGKITSVGNSAFKNCPNITSFDFSYCNKIGSYAFSGCAGLTNVTFSDNIDVTLGDGAFLRCTNLKTVKLPNTITAIPESCFFTCTSLESIQGGIINGIGESAFYNCEKLTELSLPEVKFIEDEAFENCTSLTKVDLEGNKKLKSIEPRAFYGCTSLESIDIPATCKKIYDEAFMNCESLYEVNLKSGLESIGEKAFFNCYSLYYITVPKSVESIGGLALGCFEEDGKNYSYGDFFVVGVKSSLADEYADAYNMYWALSAPKLTKIQNTSSGVKISYSKPSGASSGKYEIYRCTDSTEWKKIGTTSSLSYTDKSAKAGTKYYYTVQFVGKPTNSITYGYLETVRLSTPSVSSISNTNSGAKLTIKAVTGAAKYRVYVKSGSSWKSLGTTDTTTFTHTSAKSGKTYTYTVRAYDSSGEYYSSYNSTGYSNKFVASPKISSISNSAKGAKITWGKVAGAAKYRVFVKSGSSWKKLTDTTSTSYTHTAAKSGQTYTYTVRCVSSTGKSYRSGYDTVGTTNMYLSTPVVSKISNTTTGAKITWGQVKGAAKYNIYVKIGSSWSKLDETTTTSFVHADAVSGTTYYYRVRAYDETGIYKSAYKSDGDKNKFIAPPVISSLANTSKGVKITWGKVNGAVNYRVFVKTESDTKWTKLVDTTKTSYTHSKAKDGVTYYYTVRCISSTGKSYVSGYDTIGQSILCEK